MVFFSSNQMSKPLLKFLDIFVILFPAVKHFRYCFLVNPRGVVADMAAGIKF
jgi:hypothetical protein